MRLPSLAEIDRELVKQGGLREFIPLAWPIVEPGSPFIPNWHIDAISDHLEGVARGEVPNLVINMPPRHMKSLLACVMWFCWVWTFRPESRWMFSSYSASFAIRDSVKCRDVITSPWYQERWGREFTLSMDQNQKTRFDNDKKGFRLASSVSGGNTGEGGDFIVTDDPLKALDAYSEPALEEVSRWWNETMSTRGNQKGSARVVVMQRLHESDLSGKLWDAMLDGGKHYDFLVLPAEYEGERIFTSMGWSDPRTVEGDLLWESRFDREWIETWKKELGPYGTAGQLQQRPSPLGGGLFKRENFEIVDSFPWWEIVGRVRAWDKAASFESGDYSAGLLLAVNAKGQFAIEDIIRGQWGTAEREKIIRQTAAADAARFGVTPIIWIEQEGGSGGKDSALATIQNLAGYEAYAERPTGDKIVRAMPAVSQSEVKNISLVKGDWNREFLNEIATFPFSKHDDQVDALSLAFKHLALEEKKIAKAR